MLYFKNDNSITVFFNDNSFNVWSKDDKEYEKILQLCKNENWIELQLLSNLNKTLLTKTVKFQNNKLIVELSDKEFYEIPEEQKIQSFIKLLKDNGTIDEDIEYIKPFLLNMFENPYIDAVTELYDFIKVGDFEITSDGCFLAYKKVNKNLGSFFDNGATKHKINEYTSVNEFDTNRNNLCSKGLHFCSKNYLELYKEGITIIVKINPKDVVAIPEDYNYLKGRCKRYMTVGIIDEEDSLKDINVSAMLNKNVNTVHSKEKKKEKKDIVNRITQTYNLMQQHNNVNTVANIMNISVETVKRNLRKYRQYINESNTNKS